MGASRPRLVELVDGEWIFESVENEPNCDDNRQWSDWSADYYVVVAVDGESWRFSGISETVLCP
jgi:hypothetical protein